MTVGQSSGSIVDPDASMASMSGSEGWPPGWYPDPCGHWEQRWWSGSTWTSWVRSQEVLAVDPLAYRSALAADDLVHLTFAERKVFDYVQDMHHLLEAWGDEFGSHNAVAAVNVTPEGVGSTVKMMGRVFLLFHMEWTLTREEYVPNERIADGARFGRLVTTFEPADPTGTTLSMAWEWAANVPLVGEAMDRVSWGGDEALDKALANPKKAIES